MDPPPRLAPGRALPPYAYLGPPQPHPRNDPRGHSRGTSDAPPPPLDPARWRESEDYLYGIDLFNRGYYWEAHEAWEGLWLAAEKRGPVGELMKGLIKLTAGGVKAQQGMPEGARKHADYARQHFEITRLEVRRDRYAGLSFNDLADMTHELARLAAGAERRQGEGPQVFFERYLEPRDG